MKSVNLLLALLLATTATATAAPKRVLVVSTTVGFRHSSIPTAEKIIAELGQRSGAFTVDYARVDNDDPKFKAADGKPDKAKTTAAITEVLATKMSRAALSNYDAVVFANTTGDLPMPDREALLDFVKSGKGFVGVHSATDTFPGFPGFIDMIGGQFLRHGPQVEVDILNQDKACPSCRHIADRWTVFDEIYQLKNFDRAKVHGLLTLDKHPNDKTPGDYPIAWKKNYGAGRVIYTSLGHREDIWDPDWKDGKGERKNSPQVARVFQAHLLGAIKWALELDEGDGAAKPGAAKP